MCTFWSPKFVYFCGQFWCVLLWPIFVCTVGPTCTYVPVHTYLYMRTCMRVPVSRTCIFVHVHTYLYRVPVSRTCIAYLYSVPVSRTCTAYLYACTCIPVRPYLYRVPWYLVPTLGLPLCEYLPGTLVRYLPWILHLQSYPNQPRVCHRLHST